MTDNEIAFWLFGLPTAIVVWAIAVAVVVAIYRGLTN